jgi:hypothetical protein
MTTPVKTIPIKAVSDALMCAVIRLKMRGREPHGKSLARTAAFTQVPHPFVHRCLEAMRGHARRPHQPWYFSPMDAGDLEHLLRRARIEHGRAEVRKTWGCGVRVLQAEIKEGMR